MPAFVDRTGKTYGRLTVIAFRGSSRGRTTWLCRCECGNEIVCKSGAICSGNTSSCGCLRRESAKVNGRLSGGPVPRHGHARRRAHSPTYTSYSSMMARCASERFEDYAGRGISVCARWSGDHGYENFLADMGERPPGTSIDRINVNGNYEPSNCRWATDIEQARNRRPRRIAEQGKKVSLMEAAWMRYAHAYAGIGAAAIGRAWGISGNNASRILRQKTRRAS